MVVTRRAMAFLSTKLLAMSPPKSCVPRTSSTGPTTVLPLLIGGVSRSRIPCALGYRPETELSRRPWHTDRCYGAQSPSTLDNVTGGWAALAAIIVIGPRRGKFGRGGLPRSIPGHNAVLMSLGAIILWVGFNAGSSLVGSLDFARIISNTIVADAFSRLAG